MDLAHIPYVPAFHQSGKPLDSHPADIIVIHSMECPPDDPHVTNWVKSLATPQGSAYFAHYYCGPSVTFRVAELGRVVPHVGGGNMVRGRWTLGIEQAGNANDLTRNGKVYRPAMGRRDWIDSLVPHNAAELLAELIAAGHGANRWLSPDDLLKSGVRGVTSHNNMRLAFGGTSHTDPGAAYPVDVLLAATPDPLPPPPPVEVPKMVASTANADGRQEVFQAKLGGAVRHKWQTKPNGGWSDWIDLSPDAVATKGLTASRNADGRLELYAETDDFTVRHCWQESPGGPWSSWVVL